ncbi:hypothetical protein AB0L70_10910 [Kribbella sp. NPDC051952]|uniref:hypothetical protein n=1 Tax=Kribbella sp. NPDC051952 TaxID=3154851 RepID=UPI00344A0224
MPLDLAQFNSAFADARYRQRTEENFDVPAAQQQLRGLIADEPPGDDRDFAERMIDKLATPAAPPREWSALYHEAGAIHAAAYPVEGTVDEQLTALAEARRRIWEIADRATDDEEADIRAMTRPLEHLENQLRDPSWPVDSDSHQRD